MKSLPTGGYFLDEAVQTKLDLTTNPQLDRKVSIFACKEDITIEVLNAQQHDTKWLALKNLNILSGGKIIKRYDMTPLSSQENSRKWKCSHMSAVANSPVIHPDDGFHKRLLCVITFGTCYLFFLSYATKNIKPSWICDSLSNYLCYLRCSARLLLISPLSWQSTNWSH